jgi:hypothetical protein
MGLLIAGIVLYVKFLDLFKLVPAFGKKRWSITAYFMVLVMDESLRTAFYLGILVI